MIYILFFFYITLIYLYQELWQWKNISFCNSKLNYRMVLNKSHPNFIFDYFLCFFATAKATLKATFNFPWNCDIIPTLYLIISLLFCHSKSNFETLLIRFFLGHFPFLCFLQKFTSCVTRIPVSWRRILSCLKIKSNIKTKNNIAFNCYWPPWNLFSL